MRIMECGDPRKGTLAVRRRIVLAEVAGFCFGVRRAVELTTTFRREHVGRLTTLGPIIHNEQVISQMRAEGVETAADLEAIEGGTVVLSAHGVAPAVVAQARAQGLQLLDVTCPFVTKVHARAKQLYEQGYQVLLVGDRGHTEVKGVVGAVEALGGRVTVVTGPEEIATLAIGKKVGVLSQTTQYAANFAAIVAEVSRIAVEVRAFNTVCNATDELQDAAIRMARQVEVALVVGGKKSANTRRLRELCAAEGIPAYHIETAEEIEPEWLEGHEVIGITGGASTPDWILEEVACCVNGGELPSDWRLHHPDECA
jgi:small subunit ribosomal protein S1